MKKFFKSIDSIFSFIVSIVCFILGMFALKVQSAPGMRSQGTAVRGAMDVITQPLYDSILWTNADVGDKVYFNQPIGSAGKTLYETNLKQANTVPAGQIFMLYGFSLSILGTVLTPAEITGIFYTTRAYAVFRVLEKDYLQLPLHIFPCFSRWQSADTTIGANSYNQTNVNYFKMSKVIPILGQQNFSFTISIQTAVAGLAAPVKVAVLMHGTLKRNLQ